MNKEERELAQKAMVAIELICLYENPHETNVALNSIYKISHTINLPNCRKNHPHWIKEIEKYSDKIAEELKK